MTPLPLLCVLLLTAPAAPPSAPASGAEATQPAAERAASKITPGRDTTYYDGPVRDDGTIDYIAALNEDLSRGVKPEENAFLALVRLLPGEALLDEKFERATYEKLGADVPGEGDGPRFSPPPLELRHWQLGPAGEGPWRAEQAPEVAAWLEQNREALDAVRGVVERPEYYAPLVLGEPVEVRGVKEPEGVEGVEVMRALLPALGQMRQLAVALSARGRLRVGEGDVEAGLSDAFTLIDLGSTIQKESTLIGVLVGGSIYREGLTTVQSALSPSKLNPQEARALIVRLAKVEALRSEAVAFDRGERLLTLDAAQAVIAGRVGLRELLESVGMMTSRLEGDDALPLDAAEAALRAQPNAALRQINARYDELVNMTRERDVRVAWRRVVDLKKALEPRLEEAAELLRGEGGTPEERARAAANVLIWDVQAAQAAAVTARMRLHAWLEATRVGVAVTGYHFEHGRYPESLDALVPTYLDRLPADPFGPEGGVLRYRVTRKGAMIYSVGSDGNDDEGQPVSGDRPGDLVLSLPVE